jgi:hypothetical protein
MDLFPDLPGFDIEKSRDTKFATEVQTAVSGKELRATFQTGTPRFEYSLKLNFARRAGFSVLTPQDEILALLKCYNAARGKLNPLLLIDPVNGEAESVQIAIGDGSTKTFQLIDDGGWPAINIQGDVIVDIIGFVPATSCPWLFSGGINASYPYSANGTPPVLFPVTPGDSLFITASGSIKYNEHTTAVGPDGGHRGADASAGNNVPSMYCGHPLPSDDFVGLVGAFADASGNVIEPVWIGASATLSVPPGAAQLQLGINDYNFADNPGGFFVRINGALTTTRLYESSGDFSVDKGTGVIVFSSGATPAIGSLIRWTGVCARKVRFSDDSLSIKQIVEKLFSGDSIKLVSLK